MINARTEMVLADADDGGEAIPPQAQKGGAGKDSHTVDGAALEQWVVVHEHNFQAVAGLGA